MRIECIGGSVFKLIEASETATSNQEHFEHDLQQLLEHYSTILDKDEIVTFCANVIHSVKFGFEES